MASVIHTAEVAAILALAYVLGWAIGYFAHRLLARTSSTRAIPTEVAAVSATASAGLDALVPTPVIDAVPNGMTTLPGDTPAAELSATEPLGGVAEAMPEAAATAPPEDAAIPDLAPVSIPVIAAPPPMLVEPIARPPKRSVTPPPPPEPEPEVILTAAPSLQPGLAWSGEVRGRAAEVLAATPESAIQVFAATDDREPPPTETPMTIDLGELGPDSTYGEPIVPEPQPEAQVAPEPSAPVREDDAMRAIEGGWSRVQARALPGAPEVSDVGAAVAAAQSAVEQVLARAGIDRGPSGEVRPAAMTTPRNGAKDDLKRIAGLGSLDESTLNNLGVFHFDQIAGWSEAHVAWMENHVFARGRIGHENWQQQASELAAAVAG